MSEEPLRDTDDEVETITSPDGTTLVFKGDGSGQSVVIVNRGAPDDRDSNPALLSIAEVGGDDDGNVALESPDGTVSITTSTDEVGENTVGFSVAGLAELEERLESVETRSEQEIERLTARLIRIEHYVMERSVWCLCSSLNVLGRRLADNSITDPRETISEIARRAEEFLTRHSTGERIDPNDYFEYLEDDLELQEGLLEELGRHTTDDELRRLRKALEELRISLEERDEGDVLAVAIAQNEACKAYECVRTVPLIE